MKLTLRRPCIECPFRRSSVRGWLGPWKPEEILFVLGRQVFPCHRTIPNNEPVQETDERLEGCAGAAIFLNNKIERSRHPLNLSHQQMVREDHVGVFSNSTEFVQHHTLRAKRR